MNERKNSTTREQFAFSKIAALARLLCMALLAGAATRTIADDVILPVLETAGGTYSNVTVTTKTKEYIFIIHSGGMANIRVTDLPKEAQEALGYDLPEKKTKKRKAFAKPVVMARELLPEVEAKLKPFEEKLREHVPPGAANYRPTRGVMIGAAAAVLLMHLLASALCRLIVLKSKKEPGVLVWIPGLQWIPLLRAAEMSGWWFLLMWIPIVPFVWAFKIAKARGMSVWVAVFLILPVTSFFAFLYLALAREKPAGDGGKYESMSLQTA